MTENQIKYEKKKKYVFKHKKVHDEYAGFDELNRAKVIVLSPSWAAFNAEAKTLYTKEKALQKAAK